MLTITIPSSERYDDKNNEFVTIPGGKLELEHSLRAVSRYESKYKQAFLNSPNKSMKEFMDYVECMIENGADPVLLRGLTRKDIITIRDYIGDTHTATTFQSHNKQASNKPGPKGEYITSELVYYWMISFNIPMECDSWHIERLFVLIRICSIKNSGDNKQSKLDSAKNYRALNAARRAKYGTSG